MTNAQLQSFIQAVAPVVREFVAGSLRPVLSRLAALEARSEAKSTMRYVGVWAENAEYGPGDVATDRGTLWFCRGTTKARPGSSQDWQLMLKIGRQP